MTATKIYNSLKYHFIDQSLKNIINYPKKPDLGEKVKIKIKKTRKNCWGVERSLSDKKSDPNNKVYVYHQSLEVGKGQRLNLN